MQKTYILDTSILLSSPQSVQSFDEHNVVLSAATIEAIAATCTAPGEKGANAREALRIIDAARQNGYVLRGGGKLYIRSVPLSNKHTWVGQGHENDVVNTAADVIKEEPGAVFVSNSNSARIKAHELGVKVESYKTTQVAEPTQQYRGRRELMVPGHVIDSLYSKERCAEWGEGGLEPNEYVVLTDEVNPTHSGLARHLDGKLYSLTRHMNPYDIKPRNAGQQFAIDALMAPAEDIPLVILKGPAGTAKTFLSVAAGLEQTIGAKKYDRILIARPNTKFDDDIGYLKGTEEEKIGPLIRPVMDNLEFLCKVKGDGEKDGVRTGTTYVQELFNTGVIVAQAMAYMRGRSIADTFIIIDEAQNMSQTQAFGIISRVGPGSKVVLAGDPEQIDSAELDSRSNGLSYASECMRGSPLCAQVAFEKDECVRSKLALEAIQRMSCKAF